MLSRNAERVYWLGRYIERTEDTARLLKAFTQVMLDIPKGKKNQLEYAIANIYCRNTSLINSMMK